MIYINEATNTTKTFKCPFCNYKGTKPELVVHIEKEHKEMIPKDYTAARVLFNYFNKKEHGNCVVDGKETKWNEENWRYDRFCSDKCKKVYVKDFKKVRMVNKYGVEHLLNSPEQQNKMLANRSISGEYKFKDGGIRTYVGSYEQKLLEFYDKVLNVPSEDIMTPGPIFEYEYKGKKLQWITDLFYIPMNLVHDVKDGGDNPNNREMIEYREKQDAKENMIKKLNKYNYIRLTNNNFDQLLFILSEIKADLMDSNNQKDFISHINENLAALNGTLPSSNNSDSIYLINYYKDNEQGYALAKNRLLDKMIVIDDETQQLKLESYKFLHNAKYSIYKYDSEEAFQIWGKCLADYSSKAFVRTKDYFYNKITGKQLLSEDQIDYDLSFNKVPDYYYMTNEAIKLIEINTLQSIKPQHMIESLRDDYTSTLPYIILNTSHLHLVESVDGYRIINTNNNLVTKPFKESDLITDEDILLIK